MPGRNGPLLVSAAISSIRYAGALAKTGLDGEVNSMAGHFRTSHVGDTMVLMEPKD